MEGRAAGTAAFVATVTLALMWWGPWRAPPRPSHLVVISIDTLRADALGAYGNTEVSSPTIDRLADEGLLFEQHISAAPTTLASHTSLFTGTHPHTHGIPRNDYLVPESNRMLAEIFVEQGYQTAAFIGAIPIAEHSLVLQGFEHIDERFDRHRDHGVVDQTQRDAPDVTDSVLGWLTEREDDRPLMLFVHYFDVHAPYISPPEFLSRYDVDPDLEGAGTMEHLARVRRMLRNHKPEATEHAHQLRQRYLAGVTWVDTELQRLVDGLAEQGILDDALLVVTSDHGETFTSHEEIFDHGATVYDETIHTPLILRFPASWRAGTRIGHVVSSIDVLPTVLELFDIPLEETIEGISQLGALRGDWFPRLDRPVFAEATKPHSRKKTDWLNDPMRKAIRTSSHKLILSPSQGATTELYDLAADPDEATDLAEQQPALSATLLEQLERWRASAKPKRSKRASSARVRAELAALGYIEALEDDPDDGEGGPEHSPDDEAVDPAEEER